MSARLKYQISDEKLRTYLSSESIIFKKNNERFGELSNMSMKFPMQVNDTKILNSEALYQACRFPDNIELQQRIITEKSPMEVKMVSNGNKKRTRKDWEEVKIQIMRWCLNIKLAQNFISFGYILDSTNNLPIVENSSSDNYWGAVPDAGGEKYIGQNALGRLLMQLRDEFRGPNKFSLLIIEPLKIENFNLLGKPINTVDSRNKFIEDLDEHFKNNQLRIFY